MIGRMSALNKPVHYLPAFLFALIGLIIASFLMPTVDFRARDLRLIVWEPGQEFLTTGAVNMGYPYPLWTLALMWPLVYLPLETSAQIWLVCNLTLLALCVVLIFKVLNWPQQPVALASTGFMVGTYPAVFLGLRAGQVVFVSLITLLALVWAVRQERWGIAGALIGFALFKPQMLALVGAGLMGTALLQRRWRAPVAFGIVLVLLVLIGAPLASEPRQIFGGGIGEHLLLYIGRSSTLWGLSITTLSPSLLPPAIVSVALGVWVVGAWLMAVRAGQFQERMLYLIALATTINLLIVPYSWSYNHVLMLLPLAYAVNLAWKIPTYRRWIWLLALLAAYLIPGIMHEQFSLPSHNDSYPVVGVLVTLPLLVILENQQRNFADDNNSTS